MKNIYVFFIAAFALQMQSQTLANSSVSENPQVKEEIFIHKTYITPDFGINMKIPGSAGLYLTYCTKGLFSHELASDPIIPLVLQYEIYDFSTFRDGKDFERYLYDLPLQTHDFYTFKTKENSHVKVDSVYRFIESGDLFQKYFYYYDENGHLILDEVFNMLVNSENPAEYNEYSWDDAGNLILHKRYVYDTGNQFEEDYLLNFRFEYAFDDFGNEILNSRQFFTPGTDHMLSNSSRVIREFDPLHPTFLPIYEFTQRGFANNWINQRLREREYFEDGKLKSTKLKNANIEGEWFNGFFNQNTGYFEDLSLGGIGKTWSDSLQDWINFQSWEVDYEPNDTTFTGHWFYWDEEQEEWWNFRETMYEINEFNLIVMQTTKLRETPEAELVYATRSSREYDDNQYISLQLTQTWDTLDGEWFNDQRMIYDYSIDGLLMELHSQNWDAEIEEWVSVSKTIRDYDEVGNSTYIAFLNWSVEFDTWYYQFETIYDWDEFDNMILWQRKNNQSPETMNWAVGSRDIYEYDMSGYLVLSSREILDQETQEFEFNISNTYLNDFYGNVKQEKNYSGNLEDLQFLNIGFATYEIAMQIISQGEPLEGVTFTLDEESWVTDSNGWLYVNVVSGDEMDFQYTLSKDGYLEHQGDLYIDRNLELSVALVPEDIQLYNVSFIVRMHDDLIENASISLTGYGEQYTDDEGAAMFEGIAPQDNILFSVNYEDTYYEGELSVVDQDVIVELNLAALNVWENNTFTDFRVFPNPAQHHLNIVTDVAGTWQIEIFSLQGRKVFSDMFAGGETILDIATLDSGFYLIRISGNGQHKVEKLLVK